MAKTVFELPLTEDRLEVFAIVEKLAELEFSNTERSYRADSLANRVNARWDKRKEYRNGMFGPFLAKAVVPEGPSRRFESLGCGFWIKALKMALAGVYYNAMNVRRLASPEKFPDYIVEAAKKYGPDVLEARADYAAKKMNTEKFVAYCIDDAYRIEWCYRWALDCGVLRVNWNGVVAIRDWALSLRSEGFDVPDYDVETVKAEYERKEKERAAAYAEESRLKEAAVRKFLADRKLPDGLTVEKRDEDVNWYDFKLNGEHCFVPFDIWDDVYALVKELGL